MPRVPFSCGTCRTRKQGNYFACGWTQTKGVKLRACLCVCVGEVEQQRSGERERRGDSRHFRLDACPDNTRVRPTQTALVFFVAMHDYFYNISTLAFGSAGRMSLGAGSPVAREARSSRVSGLQPHACACRCHIFVCPSACKQVSGDLKLGHPGDSSVSYMAMLPNAVGCVKSEIHNVVSAMRLSRWASNARFKVEIPLQVGWSQEGGGGGGGGGGGCCAAASHLFSMLGGAALVRCKTRCLGPSRRCTTTSKRLRILQTLILWRLSSLFLPCLSQSTPGTRLFHSASSGSWR